MTTPNSQIGDDFQCPTKANFLLKAAGPTIESKCEALLKALDHLKRNVVMRLPTAEARSAYRALICCDTKPHIQQVTEFLFQNGWAAESFHGDLSMQERLWALHQFNSGAKPLLVCTEAFFKDAMFSKLRHPIGSVVVVEVPKNEAHFYSKLRMERKGPSYSILADGDAMKTSIEGVAARGPEFFTKLAL